MKNLFFITFLLFFVSCGNEKVIQLPEINHSDISEIDDVSAAYLFYDETQKDSVELNRKNLISTTNWLVNVDKRLTLKQVIPHIKFLQEKKKSSSHKNENSKNYFTCNDTNRKDLGFIEFTDVVFQESKNGSTYYSIEIEQGTTFIRVDDLETIRIQSTDFENITSNFNNFESIFKKKLLDDRIIVLSYNKRLSFQDYITFKSLISSLKTDNNSINNNEFIY